MTLLSAGASRCCVRAKRLMVGLSFAPGLALYSTVTLSTTSTKISRRSYTDSKSLRGATVDSKPEFTPLVSRRSAIPINIRPTMVQGQAIAHIFVTFSRNNLSVKNVFIVAPFGIAVITMVMLVIDVLTRHFVGNHGCIIPAKYLAEAGQRKVRASYGWCPPPVQGRYIPIIS